MAQTLQFNVKATGDASEFNRLWDEARRGSEEAKRELNKALGGEVKKVIRVETFWDDKGTKQQVFAQKEILTAFDKIAQAQDRYNKNNRDSVSSLRQQVNEAKQARDGTARYADSAGSLFGALRRVNPEWAAQNQKVSELQRKLELAAASGFWGRVKADLGVSGLINFGNGLVQITQGLQAASIVVGSFISQVNALIDATARLQSFKLSFIATGAGGLGGLTALSESNRIALGLGVSLNSVREGFQKLTPVVLNSGGTLTDVSQITEALSSRFAAFGLSADASRRVMNGVIQAFAKGSFRAEELTQQIAEADPAFKTDFAKALGVSVQALEQMVTAGEINNEVMIKTLPLLSKSELLYGKLGSSATDAVNSLGKSAQELGGVGVTLEQVRTQLANITQVNLEALAQQLQPLSDAFLKAQAIIIDFIGYISQLGATRGLADAFAAVANAALLVADVFLKVTGAVLTVISPIVQFAGAVANSGPVIGLLAALIGRSLLPALQLLPAAIAAIPTALANVGPLLTGVKVTLLDTARSYIALGAASKKAATDVVASTAAMNAAKVAGGASTAGGVIGAGASFLPSAETAKAAKATQDLAASTTAAATASRTLNSAMVVTSATTTASIGGTAALGATQQVAAKSSFDQALANRTAAVAMLNNTAAAAANTAATGANAAAQAAAAQAAKTNAAVMGVFTAVIAAVGIVMNDYNNVMQKANEIDKARKTAIEDLNTALANHKARQQDAGKEQIKQDEQWQTSVNRVGAYAAVIDRVLTPIRLINNAFYDMIKPVTDNLGPLGELIQRFRYVTFEQASLSQTQNAIATSSLQYNEALDQLIKKYDELRNTRNKSKEQELEQKQLNEDISKSIMGRLTVLRLQLAEQQRGADGDKESAATRAAIIQQLELEIDALNRTAQAKGFETAVTQSQTAAVKALADEIKILGDAEIERLNAKKADIQEKYRVEQEQIAAVKEQTQEAQRVEKEGLQEAKRLAQEKYQADKDALQEQKAAVQEYYNAQKEAIRELRAAESERAQAQIAALNALTPAEKELEQIRIRALQAKAKGGGEEALEAKAALQRIAANKEIAKIQEEERQKDKDAQAQLKQIEKEEKAAIAKLNADERSLEKKHKEQMAQLAKTEQEQEARHRKEMKKIEADAKASKAAEAEAVRKIEAEIAQIKEKVSKSTTEAAKAAREFTGELQAGQTAAGEIEKRMANIRAIASRISIPSIPGRFTGGPVTGGAAYTVNELGKEMFLSSSGKLSPINAKPWSTWRAPSSGTVIPAHVAAAIDIPRGGVQLSRGNTSMVDRAINGRNVTGQILGKMIAVLNASSSQRQSAVPSMADAAQAVQLGKLTHAVNKLVDKDWNVQVNVRSTGDGLSYARAVNRRI